MEGYTHVALGENMNSGISAATLDKLLNLPQFPHLYVKNSNTELIPTVGNKGDNQCIFTFYSVI